MNAALTTTGAKPLHGKTNARRLRRKAAAEARADRARQPRRKLRIPTEFLLAPSRGSKQSRKEPWTRSKPSPHRRRRMKKIVGNNGRTVWAYQDEAVGTQARMGRYEKMRADANSAALLEARRRQEARKAG